MQHKHIPFLIMLCAITACRSYDDNGIISGGIDAAARCPGSSSKALFELPEGSYSSKLIASDTKACGFEFIEGTGDQTVEVVVTERTITLAPGEPTQVSIVRSGNQLCGTSRREFRYDDNSNLCILDEADSINGEVTAAGEFWVDLDFDWQRKGGVCNSLSLPCSGRITLSLVSNTYPLEDSSYDATITKITENICDTTGISEGFKYFVKVDTTSDSLEYCRQTTGQCLTLQRDGNWLSYTGMSDVWTNPQCDGLENIIGAITSPTSFALTRTWETSPSCSRACRIVFNEVLQKR